MSVESPHTIISLFAPLFLPAQSAVVFVDPGFDGSFDDDLGANGYDYYAVIFTGESDSDVEYSIDNVALVAVPEPSLPLLGALGSLLLMRRRRG